jgi:hypothetical protein
MRSASFSTGRVARHLTSYTWTAHTSFDCFAQTIDDLQQYFI